MRMKMCAEPGCSAVVPQGERYCEAHRKRHERKPFQNATRAGNYHTAEWRALKRRILESHPFCAMCGASGRLEVHHIRPVRTSPELMLEPSNLMVLCHACHCAVTRREMEERRRRR